HLGAGRHPPGPARARLQRPRSGGDAEDAAARHRGLGGHQACPEGAGEVVAALRGVIADNRSMPSRRTARIVARFLLAWFALYLGAATAAPLVAPGGYAVICSADGIARLVQTDDAGVPGESRSSLHCPLCVP